MKRTLHSILALALACTMAGCTSPIQEKEEEKEPEKKAEITFAAGQQTSLEFNVENSVTDIRFNATDAWSVTITPPEAEGYSSFIAVYPKSGQAGDKSIQLTVTANGTLEERSAEITIACGEAKGIVKVHQAALTRLPYRYTGQQILGMAAGLYDEYLKNDLMPKSTTLEGDELMKGGCFEAMILLLRDINAGGDAWKTKEYSLQRYSGTDNDTKYDTYVPDTMPLSDLISLNERQYNYAQSHSNSFANYCSVDGTTFSLYRSYVVTARVLHAYKTTGSLPATFSTWQSDFLHNMKYNSDNISDTFCDLNNPVVTAARDEAVAGCNTDYEKVVAIFKYARDKWEWLDYYNTQKGALTTISTKQGNCCDLSHGMIAIARSAGIPARYVHGPETYYPSSDKYWGHVWAELYADGKWYVCDASNNASEIDAPVWDASKSTINGKYRDLLF